MATKKQKREQALKKREEFMAKEKARGLRAQKEGARTPMQELLVGDHNEE